MSQKNRFVEHNFLVILRLFYYFDYRIVYKLQTLIRNNIIVFYGFMITYHIIFELSKTFLSCHA